MELKIVYNNPSLEFQKNPYKIPYIYSLGEECIKYECFYTWFCEKYAEIVNEATFQVFQKDGNERQCIGLKKYEIEYKDEVGLTYTVTKELDARSLVYAFMDEPEGVEEIWSPMKHILTGNPITKVVLYIVPKE